MSGRPILYSFRRCPYAIRARLALLASGTPCVIREVRLSAKPDALIAASPKATVPVLVLGDGRVIDQSLDIMRWALGRHDPAGWLERVEDGLIQANDARFKHHLDRAKYADRYREDAAAHHAACLDLLRPLDERLARAAWLCGEEAGLTDAAILPFVRQFAAIDRAWFDAQPLAHVRRWLDDFLASSLFKAAMVRLEPWHPGEAEIVFADPSVSEGAIRSRLDLAPRAYDA